jgi:hypothetical protein
MDNDLFAKRVRAAAGAGWRTVIVAFLWITVAWCAGLWLISLKPDWLIPLWGGMITWDEIHMVMIWFFTVFKIVFFVMIMTTIWLTFWASRLKKM